jgi:hypothetical protein
VSKNEFKAIDQKKDLLNFEIINQNFKNVMDEIEGGQNKYYINLFNGLIFCIQGFKNEIKSKILKLISFCNGFYFDAILENTNYVIVPLTFDNSNMIQNKINIFGQGPIIVTSNWIFDCINQGKILGPELYRPIKSIDVPKNRTNNIKVQYFGDVFKGQTFSIYNKTYKEDKINEIKEKIVQNMGEFFDAGNSEDISDFKTKFIILNDGFPSLWDRLIKDNLSRGLGKLIISHRFIDESIMLRKIIECTDFFDSVPYPFPVPLEEFKNRYFYLMPNQFNYQEKLSYEQLIETFGGNVDDLNKKTTHVICKKEAISQNTKNKIIKSSNKDVKIIKETFFADYIIQFGKLDINLYEVNIKT